jgi:hypothetical protein
VCTGTPVHYEQTVREEDAASVHGSLHTLAGDWSMTHLHRECSSLIQTHGLSAWWPTDPNAIVRV